VRQSSHVDEFKDCPCLLQCDAVTEIGQRFFLDNIIQIRIRQTQLIHYLVELEKYVSIYTRSFSGSDGLQTCLRKSYVKLHEIILSHKIK
jgi:hypothetical protein